MLVNMVSVRDVFITNSYFYIDEASMHGFLIDPGAQPLKLMQIIQNNGYTIEKILLTHGHFDHTGAVEFIAKKLNIPYLIHKNGEKYLCDTNYNLSIYYDRNVLLYNAKYFDDNENITLQANSNICLRAIHTPGHTPDSVVFYDKENSVAFVGDTIFKEAIGTSQYPGGNPIELKKSIFDKIFRLPSNTLLYSGHSDKTTIKTEKLRYGLF